MDKNKEAIAIVRQMVTDGQVAQDVAEKYFPELAESEDEKIRKFIATAIENLKIIDNEDRNSLCNKALAWLEKQGEHDNFRNKIQIGDKVTRNKDGVLVNLSQLNRVAKKQGEQKPAWSEEDEKQARQIERIVSNDGCTKKLQEQIHNWFESLKERVQPQNTWKPSDEQMKLLREVQQAVLGKDCHNRFVNFMYELKRLME